MDPDNNPIPKTEIQDLAVYSIILYSCGAAFAIMGCIGGFHII